MVPWETATMLPKQPGFASCLVWRSFRASQTKHWPPASCFLWKLYFSSSWHLIGSSSSFCCSLSTVDDLPPYLGISQASPSVTSTLCTTSFPTSMNPLSLTLSPKHLTWAFNLLSQRKSKHFQIYHFQFCLFLLARQYQSCISTPKETV